MSGRIPYLLGTLLVGIFVNACGPSFTNEEAVDECTRLRNDLVSCFTDDVYDQCVACHEECGRECSMQESCPEQFLCD